MSARTQLSDLLDDIERQKGALDTYRKHWRGEQSTAYLSKKSRDALDARLSRLAVNAPRLVIRAVAERLTVTGFRRRGATETDAGLWERWVRAGMPARANLVHTDRLNYGMSFVTVWGDETGAAARVSADSPLTMTADMDPLTGEPLVACRRWETRGKTHALVYSHDQIERWTADTTHAPAGWAGWKHTQTVVNPFGVVPVTPFVRRCSADDHTGTSLVTDIIDLSDALGKVMQDSLVTSEYFARPRRWAVGLEVEEDSEGNPIDPFANDRKLVSEAPDTKFGQFDASGVDGYTDLVAVFWQQIGALTGLPPHYLGLHGDQPASAESVRASEATLTSNAYAEQQQLEDPWGRVARLTEAVETQTPVEAVEPVTPVWASPEIRTPAQAADAAAKLHGMGVPLRPLLVDPLGYDPEQADRIMATRRQDRVEEAGTDLGRFLP